MKHIGKSIMIAAVILAACGDDSTGPAQVIPAELTGTWTASSFVFEPVEATDLGSFDPIAAGGSLRLDVRADGEVVTTTVDPGSTVPNVEVGMMRTLPDGRLELQLGPGSEVIVLEYQLDGNRLTLSGQANVEVAGYEGPAFLTAVFVRG